MVSVNEPFFAGHFPDYPIMPGVLIVEAMAQTAACMVSVTLGGDTDDKLVSSPPSTRSGSASRSGPARNSSSISKNVVPRAAVEVQRPCDRRRGENLGGRIRGDDRRSPALSRNRPKDRAMTVSIHSTPSSTRARKSAPMWIGPIVVGPHAVIGDRVRLRSHVVVEGRTTLGADCEVYPFAALGLAPQHTRYEGEPSTSRSGALRDPRACDVHPGTAIDPCAPLSAITGCFWWHRMWRMTVLSVTTPFLPTTPRLAGMRRSAAM